MSIFAKIADFIRPKPLSCQQVNQFILDYLEGDMDDQTRLTFEAHLRNCPNCAAFLDQYQSTTRLVRDAEEMEVPPDMIDRTIQFLRRQRGEE